MRKVHGFSSLRWGLRKKKKSRSEQKIKGAQNLNQDQRRKLIQKVRNLNLLPKRRKQQKKPLIPNEDCGLFISPEKGFCYFRVDLDVLEIHDTETTDWAYWCDQIMMEIARGFGCRILRTWTIRNPLAFHRLTKAKMNPLLSGIDEDNQYKWCFEKDVKK